MREDYTLHRKAVDDLVGANKENSPVVPEEELRKYKSKSLLGRIPDGVKMVFCKVWFAGAVCFFIFWGLSGYLADLLDVLFVFGIVLGMVTDLMTNNVIRFYARTPGANDRFMMFPKKKYSSFFFNIMYAMVLLFCVVVLYSLINIGLTAAAGGDAMALGVGPILFGLFYTGFDMLFLAMKQMVISMIRDAKESAKHRR
ncbi:MAG: hypothetical protein IJ899_09070 [Blautia sp.]|nr:hypothetical protein [Blautia sp.]